MQRNRYFLGIMAIIIAITFMSCNKATEPSNTVATPVFDPAPGTYSTPQNVIITCATSDAVIRYTIGRGEPDESSPIYTGPVTVNSPSLIKAKAFKDGKTPSQTARANYLIGTYPDNFVYVWGGTFNNGSSDVTVSGLLVDKYELTQAAYQAVMGSNPASSHGVGDTYPVYYVDWFDAVEYCNRRSIQEGFTPCYSYSTFGTDPANWPTGWNSASENHLSLSCNWSANGYRLLTEAEWEFTARGGNLSQGYTYSGGNDPALVAWTYSLTNHSTHPVGQKLPNELGIYDMSGNVKEWCWDISNGTMYPSQAQTDPHGPNTGEWRVLRGGTWRHNYEYATVTYRSYGLAASFTDYCGFRVCRKM